MTVDGVGGWPVLASQEDAERYVGVAVLFATVECEVAKRSIGSMPASTTISDLPNHIRVNTTTVQP